MILIVDTETNGRKADAAEVIELAYAEVDPLREWDFVESPRMSRFRPVNGSTPGALSTHHILDEELEGHPPSHLAKLPTDTKYIIGHGVDFDWEVLGKPDVKRICTLALSRSLHPELDSHRLGAMVYHFVKDKATARMMLQDAHRAAADVILCKLVLNAMMRAHGFVNCTPEWLWEFSEQARVPKVMPFGKWSPLQCGKEVPIKDLPYDYKVWCLKQKDMDPYVLRAIRESL